MPRLRGTGAALVLALLAPHAALAQGTPPHDDGIDVQLFQLALGPKTFLTVDSADGAPKDTLVLDAMVTYLTDPFSEYYSSGSTNTMIENERYRIVQNITAAQLMGAYGLSDKLQLGASLPIVFSLQGNNIDPASGMATTGMQVTGLGDLLLEAKQRVYAEGRLRAAVIGGLTLPTMYVANNAEFTGDKLPTVRVRAAAEWGTGPFSVGATAGLLLRDPQDYYGTTIGQQFTWGVGASYAVTDRFAIVGEAYGRAGLQDISLNNSPIEANGALRVGIAQSYAVVVGGGGGLDQAIGAPTIRAFAALSYVPGAYKAGAKTECLPGFEGMGNCPDTETDHDHDGIPDKDDKCPNAAEDHDGFEDEDGCPDLDNDKDGIPDLQDRCPNDPEDGKPPYPHDGCPANKRDSDGDGIPDNVDQCPLEEEDFDGFEDADGCPDPDNDHDGILDAADKCPVCPEDKDGFEDSDGCPDLDNDHDGIPDAQDKCPNEPETVNGYQDADGCPDTGGLNLVRLDGDRLVVDRVPSLTGASLNAAGQNVANQMALVMLGHSEVTKWLIAISQKDAKDAQRIGDAIKAYLAKKGLTNADVLAAAGPPKIGAIVQERLDPNAPPVCPADMVAKPQPHEPREPATPATPAPANATPAKALPPPPPPPAATPAKPAPTPAPKKEEPKKDPEPEIELN
ncbi:MAG TPA: transporter [Kofleriaceae bacterium]|nr:transporter [Kofleriaceae bacterium]